MLTCKETSELISARYDRRLSLRERVALRLHLMMCRYCRAVARQIEYIQFLAGLKNGTDFSMTGSDHLPESARHRIAQSIRHADSNTH